MVLNRLFITISAYYRNGKVKFSRYGGDEFVIYLKGLKLNDLDNFLSQLSTTIKTEFVNTHKMILCNVI